MKTSRRFVTWISVGLVCALSHSSGIGGPFDTATVEAPISATPFSNTTTTLGSGAVGASARAGGAVNGTGSTVDPIAGINFDDRPLGVIAAPLTAIETARIGLRLGQVYSGLPPPFGTPNRSLLRGEAIVYRADAVVNKTPLRPDQGGNDKLKLSANATATGGGVTATGDAVMDVGLTPRVAGSYTVTGNSSAKITGKGTLGFAVAALRDPITYQRSSAGANSVTDFAIGDATNPFLMQVTDPGAFADAFFDLTSSRDGTLVAFDVYLDFNNIIVTVDDFTASPGFPLMLNKDPILTGNDFASYLLSLLTFDPASHTLMTNPFLAPNGIPLYELTIANDTPVTMSFASGAIVGIVAEPSALAILLLGLLPLALGQLSWRRRIGRLKRTA